MIIKNVKLCLNDLVTDKQDVIIENGAFKYIGKLEKCGCEEEAIDASGCYMVPGFIDCHTHGFNGYRAEDGPEELRKMAVEYAKRGITGFYATVGPESNKEYFRIFENYRKAFGAPYAGARFLGLHLEGPFISKEKKGAMEEEKIRSIDGAGLHELLDAGADIIKMMTIAPEIEGACDAIKMLAAAGITVSLGHSMASYSEAVTAISAGATQATHTYNAMRPYDHRETGIIGASMLSDKVYCELIMDCVHVSPEAMRILVGLKGTGRVMAVSDGDVMCGSNCPDGDMGSYEIRNGAMYLKNGVLCGSTRDLADHFRTIVLKLGYGIPDAVRMTSANCAEHMGIRKGRIGIGYDADFDLLDEAFRVSRTFIAGQSI